MHEQYDSVALFASMMPIIKQAIFISSIQSSARAYMPRLSLAFKGKKKITNW